MLNAMETYEELNDHDITFKDTIKKMISFECGGSFLYVNIPNIPKNRLNVSNASKNGLNIPIEVFGAMPIKILFFEIIPGYIFSGKGFNRFYLHAKFYLPLNLPFTYRDGRPINSIISFEFGVNNYKISANNLFMDFKISLVLKKIEIFALLLCDLKDILKNHIKFEKHSYQIGLQYRFK